MNLDQVYAGRKGNTVHDCLVNLQTTYEISQTMHTPMSIIFNNMTGCYDRIRLNLNSIVTRRLGMDRNVASTHARTLANMQHKICIVYGISSEGFTADTSFGGSGEGSGASPTACHSQLLAMISYLQSISPGQYIQYPSRSLSVI